MVLFSDTVKVTSRVPEALVIEGVTQVVASAGSRVNVHGLLEVRVTLGAPPSLATSAKVSGCRRKIGSPATCFTSTASWVFVPSCVKVAFTLRASVVLFSDTVKVTSRVPEALVIEGVTQVVASAGSRVNVQGLSETKVTLFVSPVLGTSTKAPGKRLKFLAILTSSATLVPSITACFSLFQEAPLGKTISHFSSVKSTRLLMLAPSFGTQAVISTLRRRSDPFSPLSPMMAWRP